MGDGRLDRAHSSAFPGCVVPSRSTFARLSIGPPIRSLASNRIESNVVPRPDATDPG